jgi:hypothetical protein
MNKPRLLLTILVTGFFLALTLDSCSKKIIPEKPDTKVSSKVVDTLPVSEIDIPVQIPIQPLMQMAEEEVDMVYTSEGFPYEYVISDCSTKYMYKFRRGPLQLTGSGSTLQLSFMCYYQVAGSQRLCAGTGSNQTPVTPWSPPCTCGLKEGERRVQVGYTVALNMNRDFTIRPSIKTMEPVPFDKCTVCLWGSDITSTVMERLKAQMEDARKALEDTIRAMQLKPRFQQLWDALNAPVSLYNQGWLQINPEQLRISNYSVVRDTLSLSLGLSARPVVSQFKPATGPRTVVPDISDFNPRKGFSLHVEAQLDYDSLSNLLTAKMLKKRVDLEQVGKYIIIEQCRIYGADKERLILQVDFTGSAAGTFYLTGQPLYNPEKKQLEIAKMEFDIKTKDLLVRSASWMFNRKILNALQGYSKFDLTAYETDFLKQINQQVSREVYPGVVLFGTVQSISLSKIQPLRDRLVARVTSAGNLGLRVNKIPH